MRHVKFLVLALVFAALPAWAQEGDGAVYQVQDVAVDVTADSATHARDRAILQAQSDAFKQLLGRLGADEGLAAKQDDAALAALVQGFEVQEEHVSSVRYIGTFTVQFKPNAVRGVLGKKGVVFDETRSPPVLVLPVVNASGRSVLWEDSTKWRSAWESAARHAGIVPVVAAAGDLDDIKLLSTAEALSGKTEGLAALMQKYRAGSVLVAVLNADLEHPDAKQDIRLDLVHYDATGKVAGDSEHLLLAPAGDAKAMAAALDSGVKQARGDLDQGWKMRTRPQAPAAVQAQMGPLAHLPVVVPIATLADWARIKARLGSVGAVSKIDVITLSRGTANIEVEFHGDIPQLQTEIAQQGLALEQAGGVGAWTLRGTGVGQ